jgi:quercetin dioxygenase-like cupin family protein
MTKYSKFTFGKDAITEPVDGRDHFWHYSPDHTKGAGIIMVKVVMAKGGKHDFHRHPEMNEIIYVLKGTAEQWIEDESKILVSGDSIYIDPDIVHATFNTGDEDLEFLAILEKRAGFTLGTKDVFINFTGGISVDDPALDLAVIISILSSYFDIAINKNMCFAAEIGLSGELRPVSKINLRIKEAAKLGFKSILISKFNKIDLDEIKIKIIYVEKIEEIISTLFK